VFGERCGSGPYFNLELDSMMPLGIASRSRFLVLSLRCAEFRREMEVYFWISAEEESLSKVWLSVLFEFISNQKIPLLVPRSDALQDGIYRTFSVCACDNAEFASPGASPLSGCLPAFDSSSSPSPRGSIVDLHGTCFRGVTSGV
jgi:hypothetical protein